MKINKLLISSVAIFLTVLFSSYSMKSNAKNNVKGDSIQSLLNCTKNPYDYVGEMHIALMDSVIKGKINIADVPEFYKKAFNSRKELNDSTKKLIEETLEKGKAIRGIKTQKPLNSFINNNKLIPQTWKPYLQRINKLIESNFADTISLRYVFSFIDKDILNDAKLSEGEKAYLLSYSAVTKYSYKYFMFDKSGKPKEQFVTMTPLKRH